MKRLAVLLVLAAAGAGGIAATTGCSSSSSSAAGSDGGGDDGASCAPIDSSACGQPCDPGNSLGIGRFCNTLHDCDGTKIPTLCATLGAPDEHFCTAACSPADAGEESSLPTDCGENAICACQGGQCGCFPTACNH